MKATNPDEVELVADILCQRIDGEPLAEQNHGVRIGYLGDAISVIRALDLHRAAKGFVPDSMEPVQLARPTYGRGGTERITLYRFKEQETDK